MANLVDLSVTIPIDDTSLAVGIYERVMTTMISSALTAIKVLNCFTYSSRPLLSTKSLVDFSETVCLHTEWSISYEVQ